MTRLSAGTGWQWLKQGFALFRQQPGFLSMLVFINFLVAMLLNGLPVLGGILSLVLIPSFTMAIMKTCQVIDDGQRVHPSLLLTGFRKDVIRPLCKLGLVYFGVMLLLMLAVTPFVDMDAMRQMGKMTEPKMVELMQGGTGMALLMYAVMVLLAMLMLAFAPALTYWKQMPTFKAIFYSVFAIIGSLRAVLTMVFAWLGIFWIAAAIMAILFGKSQLLFVVAMWLNLIFMVVLQCGFYAAYKQIIGAPEDAPLKPL
jgi:hypothetical protein